MKTIFEEIVTTATIIDNKTVAFLLTIIINFSVYFLNNKIINSVIFHDARIKYLLDAATLTFFCHAIIFFNSLPTELLLFISSFTPTCITATSNSLSYKVTSISCRSSLEVAPGKYLNLAIPLIKALLMLYFNLVLKLTMLSPQITTLLEVLALSDGTVA